MCYFSFQIVYASVGLMSESEGSGSESVNRGLIKTNQTKDSRIPIQSNSSLEPEASTATNGHRSHSEQRELIQSPR